MSIQHKNSRRHRRVREQQQRQQIEDPHVSNFDNNNNSNNQRNATFSAAIPQTAISTMKRQKQQERQQKEVCIDPIKCTANGIAAHIFLYITSQKDCLTTMTVSKLWMVKVPTLASRAWNTAELIGSREAVQNTQLHRCLGPHVQSLIISRFSQQLHLYQMMDIAQKNGCIDQTDLGKHIS